MRESVVCMSVVYVCLCVSVWYVCVLVCECVNVCVSDVCICLHTWFPVHVCIEAKINFVSSAVASLCFGTGSLTEP